MAAALYDRLGPVIDEIGPRARLRDVRMDVEAETTVVLEARVENLPDRAADLVKCLLRREEPSE